MSINVRLIFPYPDWPLLRQTPQHSGRWGNYNFLLDDKTIDCDYLVVIEYLPRDKEAVSCPPENTIFMALEPPEVKKYDGHFLRQFRYIITCQREIKHPNANYFLQGQPWHVNKDYDFLSSTNVIKKTKKISIICSNKQFTEGHRKRLEFCTALKDYFGDAIDFFGRGIREVKDKWDTLAPYQYSVAIENSVHDDYLTEKLYDCYLAHTFPIYYGCPNAEKYFSDKSFLRIDISNLEGAKKLIEKILSNDRHYEENLAHIIEAKKRYLQNYNIFPLIVNFIESRRLNPKAPRRTIVIYKEGPSALKSKVLSSFRRFFCR